ncbi:Hypothetical_protein [Hexamita inflata]|uniref:Hypothetical_protein n=1 Tax=Hexamita inflata TaxID=28002 RepID=A0AA86P7P1_9EUKA|nr:Hypothetical protein HINF_LOCUS20108 [Hexamita inflata]
MQKSDIDKLCIFQKLETAEKILFKCKDGSARRFLIKLYEAAFYICHLCMETLQQAYVFAQKSIEALGINSTYLLTGSLQLEQNCDLSVASINCILNYALMTKNICKREQSKYIIEGAGKIFKLLTGLEMEVVMKEKLIRMSLM